jgi:ATP-binding cassette, subfamily B, bacterial
MSALHSATEIESIWWPLARIGDAVEELALRSGLRRAGAQEPLIVPPAFAQGDGAEIAAWLDWAGERLGIEAVALDIAVPDLGLLLRGGGPAILLHRCNGQSGFLALLGSAKAFPIFLTPDLKRQRLAADALAAAICQDIEAPLVPEMNRILDAAAVSGKRQDDVRAAMLRERLAIERIGGIWTFRLPASAGFWQQLRAAGVPRKIGIVLAVFALLYVFEIAGWSLIGSAALGGRLDLGWLAAWVLLVITMIPWRILGSWFEAGFALDTGRILKSRLLAGALAMAPDSVKRSGVGHLISRVMESQALESLVLNGGIAVVVAVMELGFAAWILAHGAAGSAHLMLLLAWSALTVWLGWRYHKRLWAWSSQRLDMTHDLIEAMVGHRTRLAQERPDRRDTTEDSVLRSYLGASRSMDQSGVFLFSGLPSGWIILALLGIVPVFMSGTAPTPAAMAISLGGMLVAQRAFGGISSGLAGLSRARFAWGQVSDLFGAGRQAPEARPFLPKGVAASERLIDAQGLNFAYTGSDERVIAGTDLIINRGDQILLEGPSGGGKSTLAALLTGLQQPDSGMLLLNGLDRHTLGDDWHRLATASPQFHENHILSGTIGFNLLMGRQWPAPDEDLREAEALCEELGLGDLLARMPGGIHQRVGETGWQLSHGERSRMFLARALLQGAPLTVMDESFAALDPETLEMCLATAQRRAETLVVIAHP